MGMLKIIWRFFSGADTALGWAERIGSYALGAGSLIVALLTGLPAIAWFAIALATSTACLHLFSWLRGGGGRQLSWGKIRLAEAASDFYRGNKDRFLLMLHQSIAESTDDLMNSVALWLIEGHEGDAPLEVFGVRDSDKKFVRIAADEVNNHRYSGGGNALIAEDRVGGEDYFDLKIRKRDFKKRAQSLVETMRRQHGGR